MIPRYAIVDEFEREEFEKRWQIPYGYGECYITADPDDAIRVYEEIVETVGEEEANSFIIEEIYEGGKTLFYRK